MNNVRAFEGIFLRFTHSFRQYLLFGHNEMQQVIVFVVVVVVSSVVLVRLLVSTANFPRRPRVMTIPDLFSSAHVSIHFQFERANEKQRKTIDLSSPHKSERRSLHDILHLLEE